MKQTHKIAKCKECGKECCYKSDKKKFYDVFYTESTCLNCYERKRFYSTCSEIRKLERLFGRGNNTKQCFTYTKFMTSPESLSVHELELFMESNILGISDKLK